METNYKEQIIACENSLLEAMKKKDVDTLDKLLHDDLLFIIPNGDIITKEIDLDHFRSGNFSINALTSEDQSIQLIDDTATVTVTIQLNGKFYDHLIDGQFRYIRVWKLMDHQWQVIAGSGIQL